MKGPGKYHIELQGKYFSSSLSDAQESDDDNEHEKEELIREAYQTTIAEDNKDYTNTKDGSTKSATKSSMIAIVMER